MFQSWLFPRTSKAIAACQENTDQVVDVIKRVFPDLNENARVGYERALETKDQDYLHYIWFCVMPGFQEITDSVRSTENPKVFERYMDRLLHCRNNLTDGLTATGVNCKKRSEAQYRSIRHFVRDMRSFCVFASQSPRTEKAAYDATIKDDRAGLWSTRRYRFADNFDVGSFWFNICGLRLYLEIEQEYGRLPATIDIPASWGSDKTAVQAVVKDKRIRIILRHVPQDTTHRPFDVIRVGLSGRTAPM